MHDCSFFHQGHMLKLMLFVSSCNRSCWTVASSVTHVVTLDIYTNKIGDCLFVCLFVYLSICSAMDGQTTRPNELKFGG